MQGDVVLLALDKPDGRSALSSHGRVKQVQQIVSTETPFEVILELEPPGNVWAIPSPPADWLPVPEVVASETSSALASEPRVTPRLQSETHAVLSPVAQMQAPSEGTAAPAPSSPFLAQFMLGLSEQVQAIASQAATAALAKEKARLLEDFRAQLHGEASKTLERAILVTRERLTVKVLQELNEAHETAARATYQRWSKQLEQDFGNVAQRAVSLGGKVTERAETAAAGTLEKLQQNLDASRREGVEQFRSRLRNEITPVIEEVQATVQKLAALEDEVKVRSLEICGQFSDFMKDEARKATGEIQEKVAAVETQFTAFANEQVAKGSEDLEKKSAAAVEACDQKMIELSQDCEQLMRSRLDSLYQSKMEEGNTSLKQMVGDLSRQFSSEFEGYRSYLQLISSSLAEIAKKPAGPDQN